MTGRSSHEPLLELYIRLVVQCWELLKSQRGPTGALWGVSSTYTGFYWISPTALLMLAYIIWYYYYVPPTCMIFGKFLLLLLHYALDFEFKMCNHRSFIYNGMHLYSFWKLFLLFFSNAALFLQCAIYSRYNSSPMMTLIVGDSALF